MTPRHRFPAFAIALAFGGLVWLAPAPLVADVPAPGLVVDPAVLEPFLPAPDGWTVVRQHSKLVANPEYTHSFAEVSLSKGDSKVRLTIADTDGNQGSLMALATMILTLPDDFVGEVPPATVIRRVTIGGMPGAERWNAADLDGEVSVLIQKRFVIAADGTKLDALETLRRMVESIDFKKIAALN
jgi:hypothetical protein